MKLSKHKTSLFCVLFLFSLSCVSAYNYLAILHTAARSHHIVGTTLLKGLAKAGHQVTVISPFPLQQPMENYHDIPATNIIQIMQESIKNILNVADSSIIQRAVTIYKMGITITRGLLDDPAIKKLMHSNQTFDAIICEVFLNEAHFGLSEHFNAPLIGLSTFGAISWNTDMVGSPSPPSYVPSTMLKFNDKMSLTERVGNLAFVTYDRLLLDFWYLPKQEEIYREYFPNNKRSMYDVRRDAALVLLNQHVSLSFPRPYSPNMIEVGGMHINRKRTSLPDDIQKFLDEATHGAIYFSMGSNLKSKDLPLAKRQEILTAFRSIKQRVLWKFEETNLPDKPDNVFISDWFPQDDILAHEKVLAFITHGGLLSTTESIYHAKPIIGLPIFGDQFMNMARAEQNGYGIKLDYNTLNAIKFKEAIHRITTDASYRNMVRNMSDRFKDQKEEPLERAIFWVEHVTRHKGAKYLRSASQDLNFIQYHNLDAIFILYGGIIFILYFICLLIRRAWCALQNFFIAKNEKKVKRN